MGINKIMDKILICGKSEEELKILDDNSIDAIVTDPPYELGFMGKKWDSSAIAYNVELWKECLRVLKPGGHLVAFSATRTYHRMAVAIENAGFEVRDMLEWIYAEGFPKSLNIGLAIDKKNGVESNIIETKTIKKLPTCGIINYEKEGWRKGGYDLEYEKKEARNEFNGFGTALKPAHEPIVLARKPLSEKTIVDNVLKYGTGAIDIDGCRIPSNGKIGTATMPDLKDVGKKSKESIGKAMMSFGQVQNAERIPYEQNSVGRFPANIIVTDDALNDGKISKSIKAKQDKSGSGGIWEKSTGVPAGETYSDTGSNSRYFDIDHWATRYGLIQIPKASKSEKNEWASDKREANSFDIFQNGKPPIVSKNNHPTVKPVHLMAWLIQLISKKGDIVLDPFMGSGTTGVACMQLDRNFIGIEMEEEYIKIAELRIENEGSKPIQMTLFDEIIEPEKKKIKIEKIGLFDEE